MADEYRDRLKAASFGWMESEHVRGKRGVDRRKKDRRNGRAAKRGARNAAREAVKADAREAAEAPGVT